MRKWRVVTAVAAVVLAAVTGVLLWQYLDGADERAAEDLELFDVLVASKDIPAGTSGSEVLERYSEVKKFTRASRPPTSLSPNRSDEIGELYAATAIPAGQPLTEELFVAQEAVRSSALQIAEGMQAITVNVDQTRGVAGFVAPNDSVNVIVTLDVKNVLSANAQASGQTAKTTAFLIPGVRVLAVGQTTAVGAQEDGEDEDAADAVATGLVTLEVTPRQAEQLAHASAIGSIYLSLNPAGVEGPAFGAVEEIVEAVNLFDQPLTKVQEVFAALDAASRG